MKLSIVLNPLIVIQFIPYSDRLWSIEYDLLTNDFLSFEFYLDIKKIVSTIDCIVGITWDRIELSIGVGIELNQFCKYFVKKTKLLSEGDELI